MYSVDNSNQHSAASFDQSCKPKIVTSVHWLLMIQSKQLQMHHILSNL